MEKEIEGIIYSKLDTESTFSADVFFPKNLSDEIVYIVPLKSLHLMVSEH
ncbi:MAG: hypothetical protein ACTSRG_15215 [Candidatus Helarchaeota archaeon]